ncbi:Mrp/NBP35 family ATP-binding protein [Synechococcus sp. MW101C3]|uniref:Mrp/NBP35 family ATP-binding protein n=1 Tax=Synechococcus sp. MW101C3 TaxID=210768 RepID=UPI000B996CE8|nr:Mrp/NBP35 family ATP-binding protein [Synechococcus sp. MW101C3]
MATADQAREALQALCDAGTGRSLLELAWISQVRTQDNRALFRLALPGYATSQREQIASAARAALLALDGIDDVQIELAQPASSAGHGHGHGASAAPGQLPERQGIPGVKRVIAVSSGKGGVGKSTVAVNLACALAASGLKVGLLDADIYGPNAPTMLGVADRTPEVSGSGDQQVLTPIDTCGIGLVSMGLLIQENQPVVWRGPMLNGIIRQFLYQVNWGERDMLVVDLPPGTGDAQLTLAQAVPMAGVVIVTTPQKVSLQDARRGLAMFLQMGVKVLGVVENMSVFIPPDRPETRYAIFGSGGGAALAAEAEVPLLAELPLEMSVMEAGDQGLPVVVARPDSAMGQAFRALAHSLSSPSLTPA